MSKLHSILSILLFLLTSTTMSEAQSILDYYKLMSDYDNDIKIHKLTEKEGQWYVQNNNSKIVKIDLDEKKFSKAAMELTAKDRMREIKLWSKIKKEVDDGKFDKNNVDTHQLESYHKVMINRKNTLTSGSSQPEVFNVLGQLEGIEKLKKERVQLESQKREAISQESKLGAQPE